METGAIIGISRHRIGSDGHGITTLVGFHGCPLRCKYCLNPQSIENACQATMMTPEQVYAILNKDELYFKATNGGVTFGGGEPLLHATFIRSLMQRGAYRWHNTIETSLNVDFHLVEILSEYIDEYLIDVKEMNPTIYSAYTGADNQRMITNIKRMIDMGYSNKITCRVPLIPGYNTTDDIERSVEVLKKLGVKKVDLFTYKTIQK